MAQPKLNQLCPTPEDLTRALGVRAPANLHALVCAVHAQAADSYDRFAGVFYDALGLGIGGSWLTAVATRVDDRTDLRYQSTPPELIPLWSTGVDGEHGGFIVHAPELPLAEYSIGTYCPMDSDGVLCVAPTLPGAVRRLISLWTSPDLRGDEDLTAETLRSIQILEQSLHLESIATTPSSEDFGPAKPIVPHGWQYAASSDGVGVLAPSALFAPEPTELPPPSMPMHELIDRTRRLLADGYPASALLILREYSWHHSEHEVAMRRLTPPLITAYERLGRPIFACVIAKRMLTSS